MTPNAVYHRQTPQKVPNCYATLFCRKLVLWFLVSLVLRDYWLGKVSVVLFSGVFVSNHPFPSLTGRTGPSCGTARSRTGKSSFLSSPFSVSGAILTFLTWLSRIRTWFLAIFAVGIGALRLRQVNSVQP